MTRGMFSIILRVSQDTLELRSELVRKDELIRKHYDKLGQVFLTL